MKPKIKLNELSKVEASSSFPISFKPSDIVDAIIKVDEANYIPKGVSLRAKIGSGIITGEFMYANLASIQKDPKVKSVSIKEKFKSVG